MSEPVGASRVGWLELFFDLVVIAGIAVLSEGLRADPTPAGLGTYLVLFGALWMTWVSVVLYADVAGATTRTRTVLLAMLLVAVMAATAPGSHPQRANAFAGAFLVGRGLVGREATRTGRVVASWPLLQFGGFSIPWIVAFWVDGPAKLWLWGGALVGDLVMVVLRAEDVTERHLRGLDERATRRGRVRAARGLDAPPAVPPWSTLAPAELDAGHLAERLGVFWLIVLGEAVTQVVVAASGTPWTRELAAVGLAGFAVLVGLWWLLFTPFAGVAAHARLSGLSPRFGLPLHLFAALGVLLLACGLGELAAHSAEPLTTTLRWVLCGGVSLAFAVLLVLELRTGAPRAAALVRAVPGVLAPVVLAVVGGALRDGGLTWLLVVPVAWAIGYTRRSAAAPGPVAAPAG